MEYLHRTSHRLHRHSGPGDLHAGARHRHDHPQCPAGRPFGRPGDRARRLYRSRDLGPRHIGGPGCPADRLRAAVPRRQICRCSLLVARREARAAWPKASKCASAGDRRAGGARTAAAAAYLQGVVSDLSDQVRRLDRVCSALLRPARRISWGWPRSACCSASDAPVAHGLRHRDRAHAPCTTPPAIRGTLNGITGTVLSGWAEARPRRSG